MSAYGKSEYWEERYTRDPEPFDWYQRLSGIKELLIPQQDPFINPESKILNIGAGNSRLSEELFDEGYQKIMNTDISAVCIKAMQEKYKDKGPDFQYRQMDVRAMDSLENGSFDLVLDKGTMDSVLCGDSSTSNAQKMLSEIYRVLSPNGVYFCVSYGQPEHRLLYLDKQEFDWKVETHQVNKPTISTTISLTGEDKDSPNVHFVYICRKLVGGQDDGQQDQQPNE